MTDPTNNPERSSPAAWSSPGAWAVLIVVTLLGLGADLVSKAVAFRRVAGTPVVVRREDVLNVGPSRLAMLLPPHDDVVVVPYLLNFNLVLNPGAVFGIGAGRRWFFVVFTGVAIVAAVLMFGLWTRARDRWAHAGLAMILAGGLGNLYDRLVFGCVRDFIHPLPGVPYPFGWSVPWSGREVWPYVSNVADLLLIIGVALMIGHTLRGRKHT